jgi:hypothetical protein
MDAAAAAKLVSALDVEMAKRQSRRDAVEDAAWAAEFSGDEIVLLAKRLEPRWDRLQSKPRSPRPAVASMSVEDRECALEAALDYAKQLFSLAGAIERDEARKEDEAARKAAEEVGAPLPKRRPIILGPRIRKVAGLGRDPGAAAAKTVDGEGKSKKMSRTEQRRAEQEA